MDTCTWIDPRGAAGRVSSIGRTAVSAFAVLIILSPKFFFLHSKVDVYSFGLLLCEMCVRELPVPQQIHDQIGLVTNSVLRELIMRCVRTEPEARPTMAEVITILERRAENLRSQDVVAVNGRLAAV